MKPFFLILLISSFSISTSYAQIIWSAAPNKEAKVSDYFKRLDTGNYPQDYCVSRGDEEGVPSSSVTMIQDPDLGNVWKMNKPLNRKRAEFARFEGSKNSLSPKEGDDLYISWQWKIDTVDDAKIDKEITVFQWKSASPHNQNYPLNLEYDGDLTLNAWGANYKGKVSQSSRRTILWRKAVPQGEWVSLIVRVKVNKNDFGGIVQFWFNGEQQALANLRLFFAKAEPFNLEKAAPLEAHLNNSIALCQQANEPLVVNLLRTYLAELDLFEQNFNGLHKGYERFDRALKMTLLSKLIKYSVQIGIVIYSKDLVEVYKYTLLFSFSFFLIGCVFNPLFFPVVVLNSSNLCFIS